MVALVDTEHHNHAVLARALGHGLGDRPRHRHRQLVQAQVVRPHGHRRLHEREVGVVGNEGLGKDRELHALGGGPVQGLADLVQGAVGRVEHRRNLHGGGTDDAG